MNKLFVGLCCAFVVHIFTIRAMEPQIKPVALPNSVQERQIAVDSTKAPQALQMLKQSEIATDQERATFELGVVGCCTNCKSEHAPSRREGEFASHWCIKKCSFTASRCPEGVACCCVDFCALFCVHRLFCKVEHGRCYITSVCSECLAYDEDED